MNYSNNENLIKIMKGISKKVPQGIMLGNTPVGHIEWQMYLQRDYLKLDGTPLANASNDYDELLKFAQDNSLITADTTDKSLFKYDTSTDVLTLPDYIGLCLQGGNSIEEKAAGLPNITGKQEFAAFTGGYSLMLSNDAKSLYKEGGTSVTQSTISIGTTGTHDAKLLAFDASKSNSIYSDSVTTVQPPAITLIPQIKYIKGTTVWEELDFNKLMPLGTVINFMGTTAPDYYLACDGTIYNILEYSALANFFEVQFGSKNFFGGDGTTTFAVPDLRGEFLRGTGTNSHTNQGSGDSVGVHQDGTGMNNIIEGAYISHLKNVDSTESYTPQPRYTGTLTYKDATNQINFFRPTNTSVLYCIKYK